MSRKIGPITYWPVGSVVQVKPGKWGNSINDLRRVYEPGESILISLERVQEGLEVWLVAGETVGLYCAVHEALELIKAAEVKV